MRICSPELGISPDSNLGGEVHDRELLKVLDELGVENLIILPLGKKCPPLKNAKIFRLPTPVVFPPGIFNFLVLPYLFFLYLRYPFRCLRVHSPPFVGIGAVIFKFFFPKVKLVATYHHLDKKLGSFDRWLASKFDLITTVSEETKNEMGLSRAVVIPNGVDPKFSPGPKPQSLLRKYDLQNKKVLLYLGQLIERKNIPFLMKVIIKLPKDYILMICGDGPLRHSLEAKANGRVIFTGKVPEKSKVDYYRLADVFVYPSLKEGFGLSVAEALACGIPVVASGAPIVPDTSLDVEVWVKKITQAVGKTDESMRNKYSWENSAKKLISELQKIDIT
jgi:glycosyltransferase involved in cell wall biosynthesis